MKTPTQNYPSVLDINVLHYNDTLITPENHLFDTFKDAIQILEISVLEYFEKKATPNVDLHQHANTNPNYLWVTIDIHKKFQHALRVWIETKDSSILPEVFWSDTDEDENLEMFKTFEKIIKNIQNLVKADPFLGRRTDCQIKISANINTLSSHDILTLHTRKIKIIQENQ